MGYVSTGIGPNHRVTTETICDPGMASHSDAQGVQAHSLNDNLNQGMHTV